MNEPVSSELSQPGAKRPRPSKASHAAPFDQYDSRTMNQMDKIEAEERRDAETLARLANGPSASTGALERPSSSGSKRKTKVH